MKKQWISHCIMFATILGLASVAEARNLSTQIDTLFGTAGIVLDVDPGVPAFEHTAHFTSSTLSTLGLLVEQLAPGASDFPAISSVPGFTYRYNPELEEFERTSTSLGPIFVERARTIGKRRFDVGVAYTYIDFKEINGKKLDSLKLVLEHGESLVFGEETATVTFEKFDIESHVASIFGTFGITDRWDVNVVLPLVNTKIDLRAQAKLDNVVTQIDDGMGGVIVGPFHFFDVAAGQDVKTFTAKDDKTGVGDLLLRTKYHLVRHDLFDLSPGLVLRVPTGDEDDFQGLGDTTLNMFFALDGEVSRFHLHSNLGFEVNLDDTDRSRVRYAAGVTVQWIDRIATSVDIIGSSNLKSQTAKVEVPEYDNDAFDTDPPTIAGYTTVEEKFRTDIVDIALGVKVNVYKSVIGFANVFVPLNDDGLRADFIPTVGFEVSF